MKVVILGAEGQLGQACNTVLPDAVSHTRKEVDVTDAQQVREVLCNTTAPCVINAAAYLNVELAEQEIEESFKVNAIAAAHIAKCAEEVRGTVVYPSTDYVFDGEKGMYEEDDRPHPVNVYGVSKLSGEYATSAFSSRHYIVRTSALFGPNQHKADSNFVSKRLSQMQLGENIKMVNDQWTVPTYTVDLAKVIGALVKRKLPYGVYHGVNEGGETTWHEFTMEIAKLVGFTGSIEPISTKDTGTVATRPKLSTLKDTKLKSSGIEMPDWRDSLKTYVAHEASNDTRPTLS